MNSNLKGFWIGILTLSFLYGLFTIGPPAVMAANDINMRLCDPVVTHQCASIGPDGTVKTTPPSGGGAGSSTTSVVQGTYPDVPVAFANTSNLNPSGSPQFVVTSGSPSTVLYPPPSGYRVEATFQNITSSTVPIWLCYNSMALCSTSTASFQLNSSVPGFTENRWAGYMWSVTSSGTATLLVTDKVK